MRQHIDILGYCYIALGVLGLLAALLAFFAIAGGGWLSGDSGAIAVTSTIATFVGGFLFIISVPNLIAGYGLLKRKSWARILALVLGFINLFNVPLGTILGAYTFWALLQDESERIFSDSASRL